MPPSAAFGRSFDPWRGDKFMPLLSACFVLSRSIWSSCPSSLLLLLLLFLLLVLVCKCGCLARARVYRRAPHWIEFLGFGPYPLRQQNASALSKGNGRARRRELEERARQR